MGLINQLITGGPTLYVVLPTKRGMKRQRQAGHLFHSVKEANNKLVRQAESQI